MQIGYMRVSKDDGTQTYDSQIDALIQAGIEPQHIYKDKLSGKKDDRPQLDSCLKALRSGDVLTVWKLDRLGRNLRHLVNTVENLAERNIQFKVLAGKGAHIDTTTPAGKLIFGVFASLAEYEQGLIRERTLAGLAAARARGRKGGRKYILTKAKVRLAQASMSHRDSSVAQLCKELGITRSALYRYVGPSGELREHGEKVLYPKQATG